MQLPGAAPLSSTSPIQTQDLQLRLNQRVSAEVVEVAGTRVVLSINGTPIVARLEAADAGAQLAGRKVAQFVITSLANGEIELKLAENAPQAGPAAAPARPGELAFNVLEEMGIEKSAANLMLVRAAIGQRLAVTPELLDEMQGFLATLNTWGQDEAALAAAIKAAGLPLTGGVFRLAAMRAQPFGRAVTDLMTLFQTALLSKNLPPELKEALREGLAVLQRSVLAWGEGEPPRAGDVRAAVESFGRSLENALLAHIKGEGMPDGQDGLFRLANLRQLLQSHHETAGVAEKLDTFLTGLERGQLANVRPDPVPGHGEWCAAQFLLQRSAQQPEFSPARVRIARGNSKTGEIDAASTRLVIGVDISPDETIQVDLTLVGQRARALVVTPDAELRQRSQEEMPALIEGLRSLGIQVVDSRFAVGVLAEEDLLTVVPMSELVNRRVNIKI